MTKQNIIITSLLLGALAGSFLMSVFAEEYMARNHMSMVTCVESIEIDGQEECSIFEWRGQTYATEFAPTHSVTYLGE